MPSGVGAPRVGVARRCLSLYASPPGDAQESSEPRPRGRPPEGARGRRRLICGGAGSKSSASARRRTPPPELPVHEGQEWMYVLSGRVRLVLGTRDLTIGPGEVVEFDTRTPHWVSSPGPHPAEVLAIFGPQGERMHVRT